MENASGTKKAKGNGGKTLPAVSPALMGLVLNASGAAVNASVLTKSRFFIKRLANLHEDGADNGLYVPRPPELPRVKLS